MSIYRVGFQQTLDRDKPERGYVANGRDGILYVGGGKYWVGILTGIRLLRKWGCELPVEVWYRGDCESVDRSELVGLGNVKCHDIDEMSRKLNDNLVPSGKVANGGWQAKLYAMTHTCLGRVLYLDADAYCVSDPTDSFHILNSFGFAFWHDLPSHETSIKWEKVYPSVSRFTPIQGGQLFIDRDKAWKLVHLTHYMCQHSKYYFSHMYGDQDAWRVACAALEHRETWNNYVDVGSAHWRHVAFVCNDMNNDPMIVHRCRGKLFESKDIPLRKSAYSNPQYYLPKEVEVFEEFTQVMQPRTRNASEVFGTIYANQLWNGTSGAGSSDAECMPYVEHVNRILREHGYTSVVDLGCGDGNVASKLEVPTYTGVDCCPDVVERTRRKFPNLNVYTLDFLQQPDTIPVGDCLLCKDVFHHWANADIVRFMDGLLESKKWKRLLVCVDSQQPRDDVDTYTGGYRALNYRMYPMNRYPFRLVAEWEKKSLLSLEL